MRKCGVNFLLEVFKTCLPEAAISQVEEVSMGVELLSVIFLISESQSHPLTLTTTLCTVQVWHMYVACLSVTTSQAMVLHAGRRCR